jgi:Caspase domain
VHRVDDGGKALQPGSELGAALVGDWKLLWLRADEPVPPGALDLRWRTRSAAGRSAAMAFWRERLGPWGAQFPLSAPTLVVGDEPVLDEMWTLWMWSACQAGAEVHPTWEAMCRYAEDVAQGFWPDRVPVELAVQSVFRVIATLHVARPEPEREEFLAAALELCRLTAAMLQRGARLLDDPICRAEPSLARYLSVLDVDHRYYVEDRTRGRRFLALVGDADDPQLPPRRLPLLVLQRPVAVQFKMWARGDPEAPGSSGYPLLLVDLGRNEIVLTASPASHVTLSKLAPVLTAAERAVRKVDEGAEWYDGKRHSGTLVASPEDGTYLSLERVVEHVTAPLRLRRLWSRRERAAGSVLAALMAASVLILWIIFTDPRGPAISPQDVRANVGKYREHGFALVAGACAYPADHTLFYSCRDAERMRELLVNTYGYRREDVKYLVDKDEAGEPSTPPTVAAMKRAIQDLALRPDLSANTSFLFYYSGHGGYLASGKQPWGLLAPTGYYAEGSQATDDERGWDMRQIPAYIRKTLRSRHVLVLLDNCFSGMAQGAKGDLGLDDDVHQGWGADVDVIITASDKHQRSFEDPTAKAGLFTDILLRGLERKDGRILADGSGDGVVTDQELFKYVGGEFAKLRSAKASWQRPQFKRSSEVDEEHLGQFLLTSAEP